MANNIAITGLGSGLDTQSIVTAMVKAQSAPLTRLNAQVGVVTAQRSTLSTLSSQLSNLATKADAMKSIANLRSNTASTSDVTSVAVAVGGGARPGSFDVTVQQLAAAHRSYSNGVAARDQGGLFGTGNIDIQIGAGAPVSIAVTASTTLDELATAIDGVSGLDANVVYDGSQYRLQISGTQTGAASAVTLSESGTTLGLALAGNRKQAAVDAQFTIDGMAMTRATNLVDDAFTGVSLSLTKVTSTATKVTVTADSTAITAKLTDMVNAYNAVVNTIKAQQSVVGADNSKKLTGDSTLQGLQRSLASMMSTTVGSGPFKSFSELGIATQRDGTITIDTAKLNSALSTNRDAVAGLVASNPATAFVGLAEQIGKIAHSYGDASGILPARVTAMDSRIRTMNSQASQIQARIDAYEQQLNTKFASMESQVNTWKATSSSLSNGIKSGSST